MPGGSYSYLVSWLKEQSSEPLKFPDGLCKAVFDNNQKLGKTYLISGNNIVPTSVMTSYLWVTLDPNCTMQEKLRCKPVNWMWEAIDKDIESKLLTALTSPGDGFRKTHDSFIESCIAVVLKQHNKKTTDFIDEILKEKEKASVEKNV